MYVRGTGLTNTEERSYLLEAVVREVLEAKDIKHTCVRHGAVSIWVQRHVALTVPSQCSYEAGKTGLSRKQVGHHTC